MDQLDKILRIYVRRLYVRMPMDGEEKSKSKNCVQTNGITSLKECVCVRVFKMIYDICMVQIRCA